jgi:hypothetical protein
MRTPDRLLLAVCAFGRDLPARRAAEAIARGAVKAGMIEPDVCPIESGLLRGAELNERLSEVGFDERMRRARAVIVGGERVSQGTLAESPVFEIATRARQAGVPAYAVTGKNDLDAFDARMLDLQVVLEARTVRGLSAAGRRLAALA